jgi:N-methyl-L-proline demethylase
MRSLQDKAVTFTVTWSLLSARRHGNQIMATLGTDYSKTTRDKAFDQIVVNHGTLPNDDLYHALKPLSRNRGEIDLDAMAAGQPQPPGAHDGAFTLWRIGDAVSARNTHAAIYDALRLMKDS